MMSFQQLSQWENIMSSLSGAVPDGVFYKFFRPFNPNKIHHHLGLYIFHGISPSPQI